MARCLPIVSLCLHCESVQGLCSRTNFSRSVAPGNVLPASNFNTNVPRQVSGRATDQYFYKPASRVRRDAAAEAEVPLVAPIKIAGAEEE